MEYFNFTKKERNGVFCLLAIIIILIILPFFFPFFIHEHQYDSQEFKKEIATLQPQKNDSATDLPVNENSGKNYSYTKAVLFYFDPNTLSIDGWKKLGVRDKTIQTIEKYLSKGGKFYKAEDIAKIWGFSKTETDNLIPYVKIEAAKKEVPTHYSASDNIAYSSFKKENKQTIDINTADTSAFIALPGIANKLANRIVEFRNKLGGFYSVDQVGETFGLRDSVFQLIKPRLQINNATLTQININTATIDQLKIHPYIRYNIANAIVQYRTQHGNFSDVSDVKKIMLITADQYIKMFPYLKIN
jgi:DNA uptake protein ComE-like DNA-binding protein